MRWRDSMTRGASSSPNETCVESWTWIRLLECKTSGILVEQGTDYYERLTGKIMLEGLTRSWLIFSRGFVVSRSILEAKLLSDSAMAAIGLVLALPLMLLTAIAIRFDSPGPIFYRQERVGKDGKIFTLWKFRSMRVDSEAGWRTQVGDRGGPEGDPRRAPDSKAPHRRGAAALERAPRRHEPGRASA